MLDHLSFEADKFENQDVVGMISSAGELVKFSNMVYPADAKGMVEKWLSQVEKQMVKSLRDIICKVVPDYFEKDFTKWVVTWPGKEQWARKLKKVQTKKLVKLNKSISQIIFLTANAIFCNFKNGQKSMFELGKLPKLKFHEINF